jgi:hypothetical protein
MEKLEYYKRKFNLALTLHFFGWIIVFIILGVLLFPGQIDRGEIEPEKLFEIILVFIGLDLGITILYKIMGLIAFKVENVLSVCFIIAFPLGIVGMLVFIPIYKYYNVSQYIEPIKEGLRERKILNKTIKAYQAVWKRQNFLKMIIIPLLLLIPIVALGVGIYLFWITLPSYASIALPVAFIIFYLSVATKLGAFRDIEVIKTTYGVSIGEGLFDYGDVKLTKMDQKIKSDMEFDIFAFLIAIPASIFILIAFIICLALFTLLLVLRIIFPFLPFGGKHSIFLTKKTFVDIDYCMGPEFLKKPFFVLNRFLYKTMRINLVCRDFWRDDVGQNYIETQLSERNKRVLNRKLNRISKKYGHHY